MSTKDDLLAEAADVGKLIGIIPPEHVMDIASLRSRFENLQAEAERLSSQVVKPRVDLYFRGKPVIGTRGIDVSFASEAVTSYSRAIQARAADLHGQLKAIGQMPMLPNHQLFIVDKIAGSCGFTLEAMQPDIAPEDESTIRQAILDVDTVIENSLKDDDDTSLSDSIETTHHRVLSHVRDFLKTCADWDANFKISEPNRPAIEPSGTTDIRLAAARLVTATTSTDITMIGWLRGMLPGGKRFEFQEEDQERTRTGRIHEDISSIDIDRLHQAFLHRRCKARFRVTKVGARSHFVLLNIEEVG